MTSDLFILPPEYQDLRKLREPADYVGVSGGLAVGTGEDSAGLPNLLETIGSGAYPVVVVPRLPTATGSLVGRDDFVYGRVVSDAVGVTGKSGTEGLDEIVTVSEIVVDELR